jgi:hypothetical protein
MLSVVLVADHLKQTRLAVKVLLTKKSYRLLSVQTHAIAYSPAFTADLRRGLRCQDIQESRVYWVRHMGAAAHRFKNVRKYDAYGWAPPLRWSLPAHAR